MTLLPTDINNNTNSGNTGFVNSSTSGYTGSFLDVSVIGISGGGGDGYSTTYTYVITVKGRVTFENLDITNYDIPVIPIRVRVGTIYAYTENDDVYGDYSVEVQYTSSSSNNPSFDIEIDYNNPTNAKHNENYESYIHTSAQKQRMEKLNSGIPSYYRNDVTLKEVAVEEPNTDASTNEPTTDTSTNTGYEGLEENMESNVGSNALFYKKDDEPLMYALETYTKSTVTSLTSPTCVKWVSKATYINDEEYRYEKDAKKYDGLLYNDGVDMPIEKYNMCGTINGIDKREFIMKNDIPISVPSNACVYSINNELAEFIIRGTKFRLKSNDTNAINMNSLNNYEIVLLYSANTTDTKSTSELYINNITKKIIIVSYIGFINNETHFGDADMAPTQPILPISYLIWKDNISLCDLYLNSDGKISYLNCSNGIEHVFNGNNIIYSTDYVIYNSKLYTKDSIIPLTSNQMVDRYCSSTEKVNIYAITESLDSNDISSSVFIDSLSDNIAYIKNSDEDGYSTYLYNPLSITLEKPISDSNGDADASLLDNITMQSQSNIAPIKLISNIPMLSYGDYSFDASIDISDSNQDIKPYLGPSILVLDSRVSSTGELMFEDISDNHRFVKCEDFGDKFEIAHTRYMYISPYNKETTTKLSNGDASIISELESISEPTIHISINNFYYYTYKIKNAYQVHVEPKTVDIVSFTDSSIIDINGKLIDTRNSHIKLSNVGSINQLWFKRYSSDINYCYYTDNERNAIKLFRNKLLSEKLMKPADISIDFMKDYDIMKSTFDGDFYNEYTRGTSSNSKVAGYKTGTITKMFFNSLAINMKSKSGKIELSNWYQVRVKEGKLQYDITNTLISYIYTNKAFNEIYNILGITARKDKMLMIIRTILPNIKISRNDSIEIYKKGILEENPSTEVINENGTYWLVYKPSDKILQKKEYKVKYTINL